MKFYCKECDKEIDIKDIDKLKDGKCPNCGSQEGFVTTPSIFGFRAMS